MKTVTKFDYLRRCVRERMAIENRDWYIKAFSIPFLYDEDENTLEHLDLCIKKDGLYVVEVNGDVKELVKINDYKRDTPLFTPNEVLGVDKEVMSNIKQKETTVGRLLVNAIVIPKRLEDKMPFLNKKFSVSDIESEIALRVRNKDEKIHPDTIFVEDMIEMIDNLNFFDSLGTIISTAATPKTITRAPGVNTYVQKLVKEAGDDIHDPVKRIEIENKVQAYDKEHMQDDPVYQNLFGRKALTGRFKMYGMYGAGLDFINDRSNDTLIISSVSDGIDPKDLPKYINDLRYASFSRGDNTALAGSIYKELQRSLSSVKVTPTPCKTTQGMVKVLTIQEAAYALGRYIKKNGKWVPFTSREEIEAHIGKEVEMRSPQYCKEKGDSVCFACMTLRYKNQANGVANMSAYISDTLLNMFLKLMHGIKTNLTKIKKEDLIN